ncbi:hypothetical protein ASD11_15940 [Aeromicrobium sp. Root495]|uniref:hypothetical protein n=1 Tax=Aeromicrobium sp. Root495 TaxID=1736550 RepID=UPI0006FA093E|nr:hypothetical protein [Aeromicrobium sp. Root495]KQY55972.1 hypothetical protein ASD11_15940 [Aeromicrobium sp. Root495]
MTRTRASRLVGSITSALIAASLLVATPAQAAEYGLSEPATGFRTDFSTSSRIQFSWERAVSRVKQRVDYQVSIAGNREMRKDSNYQYKLIKGYSKTSTRSSSRQSAIFAIKVPRLHAMGARIWVRVRAVTPSGKYHREDPQKASNRYSDGLLPSTPSAAGLQVTPSCKGFAARWSGTPPTNSRGVAVGYREVLATGALGTEKYYTGLEPSESATLSGLKENTTYVVRAKATAVRQRSGWTSGEQRVRTSSCSDPLRIGSYNSLVDTATGVASWTSKRAAQSAAVIRDNVDLVGVQETRRVSGQLSTLLDKLGRSTWSLADGSLGGVHVLYRSDKVEKISEPLYNAVDRSYLSSSYNAIAVAQAFRTKDGSRAPFVLVSLHASTSTSDANQAAQAEKATLLAKVLKERRNLDAATPVVVVGDVSLATGDDRRTAVRRALGEYLGNAEFFYSGRSLDLYNSRNALIRCPPRVSGVKVDGIFGSDRAAMSAWWMPKYGFSSGCFQRGFPSDHNLIAGKFWFPGS